MPQTSCRMLWRSLCGVGQETRPRALKSRSPKPMNQQMSGMMHARDHHGRGLRPSRRVWPAPSAADASSKRFEMTESHRPLAGFSAIRSRARPPAATINGSREFSAGPRHRRSENADVAGGRRQRPQSRRSLVHARSRPMANSSHRRPPSRSGLPDGNFRGFLSDFILPGQSPEPRDVALQPDDFVGERSVLRPHPLDFRNQPGNVSGVAALTNVGQLAIGHFEHPVLSRPASRSRASGREWDHDDFRKRRGKLYP